MRYSISGDMNSNELLIIVEGLGSGPKVDEADIDKELREAAKTYGCDIDSQAFTVSLLTGVRQKCAIGGPLTVSIKKNSTIQLNPQISKAALGVLCKGFLSYFAVTIGSKAEKDGFFQITATNLPPGLGSFVHYDKRLTALLCSAILSIPGTKGVEIGKGFAMAEHRGSQLHDEIFYNVDAGFDRKTNNAGGLEGGMTNGQTLLLSVGMEKAVKRMDRFILAEAAVAYELTACFKEKFGGDSLKETLRNYEGYLDQLKQF